ncbi:hypothetical protein SAMN05444487_11086 [Marininema mesophilum]|uniref:YgiT-type zinc finger domain-containing protein n=1 Tax=Marininema mesophilum TaxID=1048340 RepID=A0A1H2Z1K3_9BACL|nr:hypothetical protein [Marininema mesophilum]SDX11303.1 hypothetical protein SAMN05444487_11086 [Marininema mesophilum]
MGFCCGATMVGAVGTLRQGSTLVHNAPLLYCPVCHHVEVHHTVQEEFDLLLEIAQGDDTQHVNLKEHVDEYMIAEWKESCTSFQQGQPESILREQIDMALDLMGVAKQLQDEEWKKALKGRLQVLGERFNQLQKTC